MTLLSATSPRRIAGFSLVELMVGLVIGLIAVAVIVQSMSNFESSKRTTTAGVDAQENGLLALMAIEADIRQASMGFNHPALFSCQKFFSYYQAKSDTGAAAPVDSFGSTIPVLIQQGSRADKITIRTGMQMAGAVPTQLNEEMEVTANSLKFSVDRPYDLHGDTLSGASPPAPALPADLIVVANPDFSNCSLMRVSDRTDGILTITNGPANKFNEYNAPIAYMTAGAWPGFGTNPPYPSESLVFRVGSEQAGGIRGISYTVDTAASSSRVNNLIGIPDSVAGGATNTEIVASEIVALKAQYGVSDKPKDRDITEWFNPTAGTEWEASALVPTSALTSQAIANRQRIKAIRLVIVARSSQRDGEVVTRSCTENNATNYGPCAWTDDSSANPAPAIDLRTAPGDTEWQHYRYRVYQTVIPLRNVLWPSLL